VGASGFRVGAGVVDAGSRDKRASLVIITALDLSLGLEVARLRREDRRAAGLLAPDLAWCCFATALNIAGQRARDDPSGVGVPLLMMSTRRGGRVRFGTARQALEDDEAYGADPW
jgi:TspO/MBR family